MDFDLLVERLTERLAEWRTEARDLHARGFTFEGCLRSRDRGGLEVGEHDEGVKP